MGAQNSTRRLTIDNDDPTNVIKVSEAVVDRLRGNTEARNRVASTSNPEAGIPVQPSASPIPAYIPSGGVPGNPLQPPHHKFFDPKPNPTSLDVRQDTETALQENDEYWQQRIIKLEETHEKMNKIMEKEYNEAVDEVYSFFPKPGSEVRAPACVSGRKAVMACYKKYPNEPMRCAREVQAFSDCVDKHRAALVSNRG